MDELQEEIDSYGIDNLMQWLYMLQLKKEKLQAEMYMTPYNKELSWYVSDRIAENQMTINKITERLRKLRYEENKR
jgi:hypothetical protein